FLLSAPDPNFFEPPPSRSACQARAMGASLRSAANASTTSANLRSGSTFPLFARAFMIRSWVTIVDASLEQPPFHRVAGEGERDLEVRACDLASAASELQLAEHCRVEGIIDQTLAVAYCADFFQTTRRPLRLRDCERPIERNDGRRTNLHQGIIQGNDRS